MQFFGPFSNLHTAGNIISADEIAWEECSGIDAPSELVSSPSAECVESIHSLEINDKDGETQMEEAVSSSCFYSTFHLFRELVWQIFNLSNVFLHCITRKLFIIISPHLLLKLLPALLLRRLLRLQKFQRTNLSVLVLYLFSSHCSWLRK